MLRLLLSMLVVVSTALAANTTTQQLEELFDRMLSTSTSITNASQLHDEQHAMGPVFVQCTQLVENNNNQATTVFQKAYGDFPVEAEHAAVGMRSISKVFASAAVLKLIEMRMLASLDMQVGQSLDMDCGVANSATLKELLSMSSLAMDNRINAMRIAQLYRRRRNSMTTADIQQQQQPIDFLGFPPVCDELGWEVPDCVERFICPLLRNDAIALVIAEFGDQQQPVDVTCGRSKEEYEQCLHMARSRDLCLSDNAGACMFACLPAGEITCRDDGTHLPHGKEAYHWDYDVATARVTKRVRRGIVYDNNGYTLVDAVVLKHTGHDLTYWVHELVFKPLRMNDALTCASTRLRQSCPAGVACYGPVDSVEKVLHGSTDWPLWRGGPLTKTWVSNAFFASASDLSNFVAMLLRNGTNDKGEEVLQKQSVDLIFYPHLNCNHVMDFCLGVHRFGFGAGSCSGANAMQWAGSPTKHLEPKPRFADKEHTYTLSRCLAPNVWGWASSYGSRYSVLRDKKVGCVFMMNQYSGHTRNGNAFSSRAHFLAHNASAVLRYVF
jgi:CubicO group peptidase (beta-lactamase class C family)